MEQMWEIIKPKWNRVSLGLYFVRVRKYFLSHKIYWFDYFD